MTTTTGRTGTDDTGTIREERRQQANRRREQLTGRYGAIGISAVAAAVRYSGGAKNPAYAPVSGGLRIDLRFVEAVA